MDLIFGILATLPFRLGMEGAIELLFVPFGGTFALWSFPGFCTQVEPIPAFGGYENPLAALRILTVYLIEGAFAKG